MPFTIKKIILCSVFLNFMAGCSTNIVQPPSIAKKGATNANYHSFSEPRDVRDYFDNVRTSSDLANVQQVVATLSINYWEEHQKHRCKALWSSINDFATACLQLEVHSYKKFMDIDVSHLEASIIENANQAYKTLKTNVTMLTTDQDALKKADLDANDFLVMGGSRLVFYLIALEQAMDAAGIDEAGPQKPPDGISL